MHEATGWTLAGWARRAALAAVMVAGIAPAGAAQTDSLQQAWPLRDNSFFVEEAFNQDAGTVQSIIQAIRWDAADDRWELELQQEWSLGSRRHQFSYRVPLEREGDWRLQDVQVDYRYQALTETADRPAFAPRLSLLIPTADEDDPTGRGEWGTELNLPLSKAFGPLYLHLNAGARNRFGVEPPGGGEDEYLWTPFAAAGAFLRLARGIDFLLETRSDFEQVSTGPDETDRVTRWILSPGVRAGWSDRDRQFVFGAAVPIGLAESPEDLGVLLYLSYDLPYR